MLLNNNCLNKLIANKVSFALYRLPDTDETHLILQTTSALTTFHDHYNQLNHCYGFVVAPFSMTTQTPCIVIPPDVICCGNENINRQLVETCHLLSDDKMIRLPPPVSRLPNYSAIFDHFHHALNTGAIDKLVLSRPELVTKPLSFSLAENFDKICRYYPSAYISLSYTPISGLWLGASPELLVSGHASAWQTVSLAGTQETYYATEWSNKNKEEQQIVTDYISQQLSNMKLSYLLGKTQTIHAGHLSHLCTPIRFNLKTQFGIGDVIEQLHPTPAICGLPQKKAQQFILRFEGYPRCYYSGFMGMLSQTSCSHLFINLRCMQVHINQLTLYAGGGLLSSSTKQMEEQEIESKLQIMRTIINE